MIFFCDNSKTVCIFLNFKMKENEMERSCLWPQFFWQIQFCCYPKNSLNVSIQCVSEFCELPPDGAVADLKAFIKTGTNSSMFLLKNCGIYFVSSEHEKLICAILCLVICTKSASSSCAVLQARTKLAEPTVRLKRFSEYNCWTYGM